jgi:hypothetical protein
MQTRQWHFVTRASGHAWRRGLQDRGGARVSRKSRLFTQGHAGVGRSPFASAPKADDGLRSRHANPARLLSRDDRPLHGVPHPDGPEPGANGRDLLSRQESYSGSFRCKIANSQGRHRASGDTNYTKSWICFRLRSAKWPGRVYSPRRSFAKISQDSAVALSHYAIQPLGQSRFVLLEGTANHLLAGVKG